MGMFAGVMFQAVRRKLPPSCSSLECQASQAVNNPELLLVGISLAVVVLFALSYVQQAKSVCSQERERARAERDAFERFALRVSDLRCAKPGLEASSVHSGGRLLKHEIVDDSALEAVKTAYRETVMDVPHYEEEYDESIATNLSEEYSEEVALAVCTGSTLTPSIQQALISESRQRSYKRDKFIDAIDRELDEISKAGCEFETIEEQCERLYSEPQTSSYEQLLATWEQLNCLEDDCSSVLHERQCTLQEEGANQFNDGHVLQEYLYASLPVTYPVLAEGARLLDRVADTRQTIMRLLYRRS